MIVPLKIKNAKLLAGISIFCFITLALIWANYYRLRKNDEKETIETAIRRNSNLAVALEQFAIRTFHNADALLQMVRIEYNEKGGTLDIGKLLLNNEVNTDVIKGIGIIDRNGKLVKTNLSIDADTLIDFSVRDYFKYHASHEKDTILISKPLLSKSIHKQVIIVSRRMNSIDKSFNGVVALQIEPHTLTSFYAQANLNPHDIISLIAPDGITYARRTGNIESSGENIIKSPLFEHLKSNADSFYLAPDAIRNIPTYFSYRKSNEYPVIATVGISKEDVLAGYYKRLQRDFVSNIIITVLVILFSVLVSISLLQRRKMLNKLIEEEQRYQRQLTEQIIAAQEKERENIGHELHDNVNQVLTTVKLYLETLTDRKELRDQLLPKCIQLVKSSINDIRNLSHDLSAPTLGTRSLIDSIYALVETVGMSSCLEITFDHSHYKKLHSMKQKLSLYRIVQEQLNNIIKHANATAVWITISQANDCTHLEIRDNGKGFNPLEKRNGIGLNNITSRANILNGEAEIKSQPGRGCSVNVVLPMDVEEPVELIKTYSVITPINSG